MSYTWTKREVATYLGKILGGAPHVNSRGQVTVPGPGCRRGGHAATMNIETGEWQCPSCSRGPLEDYEARRSGVFFTSMSAPRLAADAIRQLIRDAEDEMRARVHQARTLIAQYALPAPTATVLRIIARNLGGVNRRTLQHLAHLQRVKFQRAIRQLERETLIVRKELPSTGGRIAKTYFFAARDPSVSPESANHAHPQGG